MCFHLYRDVTIAGEGLATWGDLYRATLAVTQTFSLEDPPHIAKHEALPEDIFKGSLEKENG
jgi:hypothetical protein